MQQRTCIYDVYRHSGSFCRDRLRRRTDDGSQSRQHEVPQILRDKICVSIVRQPTTRYLSSCATTRYGESVCGEFRAIHRILGIYRVCIGASVSRCHGEFLSRMICITSTLKCKVTADEELRCLPRQRSDLTCRLNGRVCISGRVHVFCAIDNFTARITH